MKKCIVIVLIALISAFLLLNLIWLGWRYMAYSGFAEGMTRTDMSSPLFPTYTAKDEDGFDYTVKYPDYLSLTGNSTLQSCGKSSVLQPLSS